MANALGTRSWSTSLELARGCRGLRPRDLSWFLVNSCENSTRQIQQHMGQSNEVLVPIRGIKHRQKVTHSPCVQGRETFPCASSLYYQELPVLRIDMATRTSLGSAQSHQFHPPPCSAGPWSAVCVRMCGPCRSCSLQVCSCGQEGHRDGDLACCHWQHMLRGVMKPGRT